MRNMQVLFPQEDNGFPLKYYEFVGILSLKLVHELNEVAMMALAKVLGAQVRQLILGLDVADADLTLLPQLLHEKYLSAMCFARGL